MESVRLHFPEPGEALSLSGGHHMIGWHDGRPVPVAGPEQALITLSVDRCGIWMHVARQTTYVHVNGRRVHKIAQLRTGDVLHLDLVELRLRSAAPPPSSPAQAVSAPSPADPGRVLRALSGPDHGRCFTLERPRLIGRSAKADIQIDGPANSEADARLEQVHGQLLLRHLRASGRTLVNGHPVHEAILVAGDHVVFSARHRFVIESPQAGAPPAVNTQPAPVLPAPPRRPLRGLLWLLVAAVLLAAMLTGMLLLGPA